MLKTTDDEATDQLAFAAQVFARTVQLPSVDGAGGDLTDQPLNSEWFSNVMLRAESIPVIDVPFATVGTGIGTYPAPLGEVFLPRSPQCQRVIVMLIEDPSSLPCAEISASASVAMASLSSGADTSRYAPTALVPHRRSTALPGHS